LHIRRRLKTTKKHEKWPKTNNFESKSKNFEILLFILDMYTDLNSKKIISRYCPFKDWLSVSRLEMGNQTCFDKDIKSHVG
jgi:hypothetical protein